MKRMISNNSPEAILHEVIEGILRRKGEEIVVLDLNKLEYAVCKYFVICHAESTVHVNSIADSIIDILKENLHEVAFHKEGFENSMWIVVDYIDVVAHVFLRESREFYNLEDLWADASIKRIEQ